MPPPGQTPGHLTFLKDFGQIPRYVGSLDGQMPHRLELQRASNPPNEIFVFYDEDSGWWKLPKDILINLCSVIFNDDHNLPLL